MSNNEIIELDNLDGFRLAHIDNKNILRSRRLALGLTQQAVADRADISITAYQYFESEKRNIRNASFDVACRVIEALEMDITSFFHNDYVFGEEVTLSKEGLRYKNTNKLISEDITE